MGIYRGLVALSGDVEGREKIARLLRLAACAARGPLERRRSASGLSVARLLSAERALAAAEGYLRLARWLCRVGGLWHGLRRPRSRYDGMRIPLELVYSAAMLLQGVARDTLVLLELHIVPDTVLRQGDSTLNPRDVVRLAAERLAAQAEAGVSKLPPRRLSAPGGGACVSPRAMDAERSPPFTPQKPRARALSMPRINMPTLPPPDGPSMSPRTPRGAPLTSPRPRCLHVSLHALCNAVEACGWLVAVSLRVLAVMPGALWRMEWTSSVQVLMDLFLVVCRLDIGENSMASLQLPANAVPIASAASAACAIYRRAGLASRIPLTA
eukprot:gnl/TRDRNA2_/TRDRNA2_83452_c0_seq1.p1 gnl/TRDRNA2_/TRDRNA2_83452_c0~~gnl/TRDRNA2_/TRDRNA2_83452_c0_seq1.p1  ORF type:complete len:326 (-),score=34.05 gnl/TRDRNA2_/TRDRNA2_83452_c0_seq1:33-1010(-)